jgi:hypothetical protein
MSQGGGDQEKDQDYDEYGEENGSLMDRLDMPQDGESQVIIHRRKGKSRRRQHNQREQESTMIVFPESNNNHSKTNNKNDDSVASYVPPLLKSLDRATLESLRRLIDARKRAETISINGTTVRNSVGGVGGSNALRQQQERGKKISVGSVGGAKNFLEIDKPPSCPTISQGYCDGDSVANYPK